MSASQIEKAEAFRALHARPGAFVIPNPYDVGTARMLAGLGFEALATTSAGCAFGLGRPDGAITRDEALAHARSIVEATPLPVSADLKNGYADAPDGVALTIRLAAASGLAGCSIEDATGRPEQPIYDLSHAVERVAAAVEAAQGLSCPFTLTARAENFLHRRPDLDDTIRRLQAFETAGADVLYAPGLREEVAIRTVCASLGKPVKRDHGPRRCSLLGRAAGGASACAGSTSARRSRVLRSASFCVPRRRFASAAPSLLPSAPRPSEASSASWRPARGEPQRAQRSTKHLPSTWMPKGMPGWSWPQGMLARSKCAGAEPTTSAMDAPSLPATEARHRTKFLGDDRREL